MNNVNDGLKSVQQGLGQPLREFVRFHSASKKLRLEK